MVKEENTICMITGANTGLGKESAIQLAKKGFKIVMVCRNKKRAEQARTEIISISNNENIDIIVSDFASLNSVRNAVKEFKTKRKPVRCMLVSRDIFKKIEESDHILEHPVLCNVGIFSCRFLEKDRIEFFSDKDALTDFRNKLKAERKASKKKGPQPENP